MQLTLFDDIFDTKKQHDLTEVLLKRGSGFENGKKRIHEFAVKNPTISEFATFLKDEYGVGGYLTPSRQFNAIHSEDHDSSGIVYKGLNNLGNEIIGELTWKQAAETIAKLVKENGYL